MFLLLNKTYLTLRSSQFMSIRTQWISVLKGALLDTILKQKKLDVSVGASTAGLFVLTCLPPNAAAFKDNLLSCKELAFFWNSASHTSLPEKMLKSIFLQKRCGVFCVFFLPAGLHYLAFGVELQVQVSLISWKRGVKKILSILFLLPKHMIGWY